MKKHPVLITAALVAGFAFAPLNAQDSATSSSAQQKETSSSMPSEKGTLLPPVPEGLILLPPPSATPSTPPVEPAATPQASLKKGSADELRQAIRIRELKTQVMGYPSVQAQRAGAECATTNEGRCVWMRNYYTLLYTTMEKLDPSLHDVLEEQLCAILERFEQHKVYPSTLIEPVVELPGSHSADHLPPGGKPASASKHPSKKKPKKLDFSL